jgi:hypothetical protein
MAGAFREREARIALSHMAQTWLRLADRYQDVGKSQPAFQQQQIQELRKGHDPVSRSSWSSLLSPTRSARVSSNALGELVRSAGRSRSQST